MSPHLYHLILKNTKSHRTRYLFNEKWTGKDHLWSRKYMKFLKHLVETRKNLIMICNRQKSRDQQLNLYALWFVLQNAANDLGLIKLFRSILQRKASPHV